MVKLYEKIYACLAASRIASAMGAAVEGWPSKRIQDTYGFLDRFLPYTHYAYRGVTWERLPGTTEDGIERQKLICQAIIAKGDRITVDDLARVAVNCVDPKKMWYMSEPDDIRLVEFIKAGVHPADAGTLSGWHALNAMARASHPIGLINAGDPQGAVRDAADVGRMLFRPSDVALAWAGLYDAAIAAALLPQAKVDSVIRAVYGVVDGFRDSPHNYYKAENIRGEIERGLRVVENNREFVDARNAFDQIYSGAGTPYAMSSASETVTKALAMFTLAKGEARSAILYGVNLGRDTDCIAAMAGGLAGALSGIESVPVEWVKQVDEATLANPYTNFQVRVEEHAQGIFTALQTRLRRAREWGNQFLEA